MEKIFIFIRILIIFLVISCGVSYGNLRSGYSLDQKAGGWLKFHHLPATWQQAHVVCHNEGAVLASPSSKEVTKALSSLMVEHGVTSTTIFTGISNTISNSIRKSMEGVPVSNAYTQTFEICIGMNANGMRAEISCSDHHPFACYIRKEAKEKTQCGTTDTEYVLDNRTGSCYKVYQDKQKWSEAFVICAAEGGHLAVINSQEEAEVIWELSKESLSELSVLIGFRSVSEETNYYYRQRIWNTVQGQSLEEAGYARWYKSEPNSINENCGSVLFSGPKEDGILNDAPCDMGLMFICEIELNNTTTLETTTQTNNESQQITGGNENTTTPKENETDTEQSTIQNRIACNVVSECDTLDKEYALNNLTGSCYKIHHNEQNWTQAYDICAAEGGHLAVINSQEEAEVIWDLAVKSLTKYSIFIGYRAFGDYPKRIWITVQGQTLNEAGYEKWNWGEPNSSVENCGGLNGSVEHGILNDVECHLNLMFICEIEPRASTYVETQK